jgi:hypothetical protein
VFTRARHWFLYSARSVSSIQPSLRSILILSTPYVLVFPVVSFLLAFPPVSYMYSSSPHVCYMPRPFHPPWLDHSNYTSRIVQVMKVLILGCDSVYSDNICRRFGEKHSVHFVSKSKLSKQEAVSQTLLASFSFALHSHPEDGDSAFLRKFNELPLE